MYLENQHSGHWGSLFKMTIKNMLDLKTYFREEGKAPSLNDNSQTKALIAQHNA